MNDDAIAQLVQIKWLLVAFVAIAFVGVFVRTCLQIQRSGGLRGVLRNRFGEDARQMLEQERYTELLSLAKARVSEAPGDAYAHWYHAMAAYRNGDMSLALESIRKAGQLQPDWRESHIEPFIRGLGSGEAASSSPSQPAIHSLSTDPNVLPTSSRT